MASRLFAETNDRHCRRSPPPSVFSFRLQSLPYRYGVVFLPLPPQDDASLTPSPTSARCDPSPTPPNNQHSAVLLFVVMFGRMPGKEIFVCIIPLNDEDNEEYRRGRKQGCNFLNITAGRTSRHGASLRP